MTNPRTRDSIAGTSRSAQADGDSAAFSRSTGLPPEMGKATSELKCKVPDVVKADFARLACSLGSGESELLREWVMLRLYGADAVLKMHEKRLRMVAGMGQE